MYASNTACAAEREVRETEQLTQRLAELNDRNRKALARLSGIKANLFGEGPTAIGGKVPPKSTRSGELGKLADLVDDANEIEAETREFIDRLERA